MLNKGLQRKLPKFVRKKAYYVAKTRQKKNLIFCKLFEVVVCNICILSKAGIPYMHYAGNQCVSCHMCCKKLTSSNDAQSFYLSYIKKKLCAPSSVWLQFATRHKCECGRLVFWGD